MEKPASNSSSDHSSSSSSSSDDSDSSGGSPAPRRSKSKSMSPMSMPVNVNEQVQRSRSGTPIANIHEYDIKRSRSRSRSNSSSRSPSPGSPPPPGSKSGSPAHSRSPRSRSKSPTKRSSKSDSPASFKSRSPSPSTRRESQDTLGSSPAHSVHSSKSGGGSSRSNSGSPPRRRKVHSPDMTESPIPKIEMNNKIKSDDEEEEDGEKEAVVNDENKEQQVTNDNDEEEDEEEIIKPRSIKIGKSDDEEMDDDDEDKPMEIDEGEVPPEEPEEEQPPPETRIEVEIPKITTDLGKALHFVKLPNFLSVETRPFDKETYEDEIEEEETLDEEGRARLKLKVENTIRWRERYNEANVFVKESNSRLVRWSDNSLSLHLGNEIFNVYKQPLQGDHNHLFIRQGTGLQGQAVFRSKLTFRPHSTDSFTHRKMTMSLADRSHKTSSVKMIGIVGKDPDSQREEKLKKEEISLRSSIKRENLKRRVREKGSRGLSSAYLDAEGSDDDGVISISAIKNKYKKGAQSRPGLNIYSSSEASEAEISDDGSDVEVKNKQKGSKRFIKDSDSEGDGSEDDDVDNERKRSASPAEDEDPSSQSKPIVKTQKESDDEESGGGKKSGGDSVKSDSD